MQVGVRKIMNSLLKSSLLSRGALPAAAMLIVALATPVRASVLVLYPFNDNTTANSGKNYTTFDSTVLASATLSAGAGLGQFSVNTDGLTPNVEVLRTGPGPAVDNLTNVTAADALANDWYFQVVLNPNSTLDLGSIEVDWSRGGTSGVRGWFVRSSVDNYASDLFANETPDQTAKGLQHQTINLGGSFTGLNTATTFRFYVYTPSQGRFMDFQNLQFNTPSASGVPESSTSTLMLVGLACGGCALWRRRR
jgi:hypothetical protein